LRASRPTDTRATNRPEAVRRQEEVPQVQTPVEPRATTTRTPHHKVEDKKKTKRLVPIVVTVVALLALLGGWLAWSNVSSALPGVDKGKYQVVLLTNNLMYFGKLTSAGNGYLKLTEAYALESQSTESDSGSDKQTTAAPSNFKLV